jgi:hypothetical protein
MKEFVDFGGIARDIGSIGYWEILKPHSEAELNEYNA